MPQRIPYQVAWESLSIEEYSESFDAKESFLDSSNEDDSDTVDSQEHHTDEGTNKHCWSMRAEPQAIATSSSEISAILQRTDSFNRISRRGHRTIKTCMQSATAVRRRIFYNDPWIDLLSSTKKPSAQVANRIVANTRRHKPTCMNPLSSSGRTTNKQSLARGETVSRLQPRNESAGPRKELKNNELLFDAFLHWQRSARKEEMGFYVGSVLLSDSSSRMIQGGMAGRKLISKTTQVRRTSGSFRKAGGTSLIEQYLQAKQIEERKFK